MSISSPLADTQFYQPGTLLALAILVLPVAVTLGLAALALQIGRAVPLWLPFLALLWLPAVPLLWLLMQSARTTAIGIAVARPWRTWTQLRWDDIQRVDQRGMVMHISGRGETLVLAPRLLRDGARLRRQILLRLPPHALSLHLSREAEGILSSQISMLPDGGVAGSLVARPQARYVVSLLAAAFALCTAAGLALWSIATAPALIAGVAAAGLLALVCLAGVLWLAQQLSLDEQEITITRVLAFPRRRVYAWNQLKVIEYTPNKALLRLRDSRTRTLCAGPHLFDSEQATILWALIQTHAREHEVLIIPRRRLPS
ncbi:MAG TPA: hypothetical protein VF116_21615 [Ktedonobacterales bacterium]